MKRLSKLLVFAAVAALTAPFGCSSSSSTAGGDSGTPGSDSGGGGPDSTMGGPDAMGGQDTRPPNDSPSPTDSPTPPPTDGGGTGTFAGMFACNLTGTANVQSPLGNMMQTLPLNSELTSTETGTAISATLVAEGGGTCTLTFTDQGNMTATVDPGQSCMFPITMPIMTNITLTFVAMAGDDAGPPGVVTAAGTTLTANLPFHLSALMGAATGEGVITGTCTKM